MVSLFAQSDGRDTSAVELEAMRTRAERIWEDANGDGLRGRTPAETPTPSKPRRISSGVEIDRAGSPIPEEEAEEQMEEDDGADDTPESKRIVIANIPPNTSESDLRQHLRAHHPIKLKHAIRPPKKSEAHVYALPPPALACGLAKVDLASAAAAARAARALDGSRLHRAVLVVRRYRGGGAKKTAGAQKRRAEVDQQLRECKRQRMGEAPAAADVAGGDGGAAPQVYPFTFAVAAGAARREGLGGGDVDVGFEDISAEVEARLAEQAARRAEAKRKGDGAAVGRKRKRVSAEGVEEEAAACAAIAGMAVYSGTGEFS
ncbi:hypothetical protein GTA08_BOTSDO07892 [Neofusicoccum parvum]|uniref:Uncharacterized protein n=1 Tax=Neofusicoccum parvum TaxID=310453 RepID=A0ACB5SA77_9PEZI|nr:hypothetical protein GTA08_BOTSDO07892 [Neofusicoccum parvum]